MGDEIAEESAARPPAWQRRKAFRKTEILAAALEVTEEAGPERMSMTEIAARANVSEATVYKYFESKNHLLDHVILASLGPMVESLEREIPLVPGCELKLRFFIVRSMADMVDHPMISRAIYGELRWGRRNDTLKDLHRRLGMVVRTIFTVGIEEGEIDPDADVVLAGDMLFGGLASVGWRTLLAGREVHEGIEGFAARFVRQLLSGVRVQPTEPPSAVFERLERLAARLEKASGEESDA